jgi:hypothetical protein
MGGRRRGENRIARGGEAISIFTGWPEEASYTSSRRNRYVIHPVDSIHAFFISSSIADSSF